MYKQVKCGTCRILFPQNRKDKIYCTPRCRSRAGKIWRRYKATPTDIYKLYKLQRGRCAICEARGDVQELGYKKYGPFCIDHDHKTGKVRGLLCSHCNKGLGLFRDCQAFLVSAIEYLIKHSSHKKKSK